jgi:hypothetical protein
MGAGESSALIKCGTQMRVIWVPSDHPAGYAPGM